MSVQDGSVGVVDSLQVSTLHAVATLFQLTILNQFGNCASNSQVSLYDGTLDRRMKFDQTLIPCPPFIHPQFILAIQSLSSGSFTQLLFPSWHVDVCAVALSIIQSPHFAT